MQLSVLFDGMTPTSTCESLWTCADSFVEATGAHRAPSSSVINCSVSYTEAGGIKLALYASTLAVLASGSC